MTVLAIDLGGTKLALALFDGGGELILKQTVFLQQRRGTEVGDLIRQQTAMLLHEAGRRQLPLHAIGVSVPGICRVQTGAVWVPNIPGWEDYPLLHELNAISGGEVPVYMDSDRACCILAEAWRGTARGCKNAVFLAIGTGIGAGIMVDGRVLRGAGGSAGAVGWLALDRPFDDRYSRCGCFEYYASGEGIARLTSEYLAAEDGYSGVLASTFEGAEDVFAARAAGDALAERILRQCTEFWGMAAANLVSLFNPEKIIFGGGVFGPALSLLGDIYSEACKWAQPVGIGEVRFEGSALGADAALCGAAYLALHARSLED